MTRFTRLAIAGVILAFAAIIGFVPSKPAKADVTVGYPYTYSLVADLNAVGASLTVYNIQGAGSCIARLRGSFSASLDVYTSVNGTFSDAVKQGSLLTAPAVVSVGISALSNPPTAIRVQNRVYTSGDPLAGIDCSGGGSYILPPAAVVQPTPAATP
jgi:hypothetical protein